MWEGAGSAWFWPSLENSRKFKTENRLWCRRTKEFCSAVIIAYKVEKGSWYPSHRKHGPCQRPWGHDPGQFGHYKRKSRNCAEIIDKFETVKKWGRRGKRRTWPFWQFWKFGVQTRSSPCTWTQTAPTVLKTTNHRLRSRQRQQRFLGRRARHRSLRPDYKFSRVG